MQHLSWRHLSISAISQLLLARFWPNFKGRFLGTSRRDSYCYGDICPGNICPGDICPYQEYLSCYSTNLDETLNIGSWDHLDQIPTVLLKLTLFPTGVVVRMGPWSRINLFVCFFPPIPPPSQVLVSFALTTSFKTSLLSLLYFSVFFLDLN